MTLKKNILSRRSFLRGAIGGTSLAIGLPPLEAMFDANGAVYASNGAFPRRFGMFFWGNGVIPDNWIPATTGTDYELSEQLLPLAAVKDNFAVITGLEVKTGNDHPHGSGPAGLLSGNDEQLVGDHHTYGGPTFDQILAREIGGDTVYRSLEVGVQPGVRGLSYNGPDSVNPPVSDPAELFERLFGASFRAPGDEPIVDPALSLRRSVLDAVSGDATRLRNRLGTVDQQRLDQHMSAVRDLELRIARLQEDPANLAACMRPEAPAPLPPIDGRPQMSERSRVMSDLATMAYACDLTRVMSYWYSQPVSDVLYPGMEAGHHILTHDEPGEQPQVNAIVIQIMHDFAYFIESLRSIPEGDGTLLDNSVILGTTDVSYARTHQIHEYPLIVAGTCCGAIRNGFHHRSSSFQSATHVPLTIMRAMGANISAFGEDAGRVTDGLSELEV